MRKVDKAPVVLALLVCFAASAQDKHPTKEQQDPRAQVNHQHDFDWEIGDWNVHLRRLLHPLTGSKSWAEFEGTAHVRKVWDGRANLLELELHGPSGQIEGLSLRLYDPRSEAFASSTVIHQAMAWQSVRLGF